MTIKTKIHWYVGMPVYVIGYKDCKVVKINYKVSYPIYIEGRDMHGEVVCLGCTLDAKTSLNMVEQDVFFEPLIIPYSAKRPKRWRAKEGEKYFIVSDCFKSLCLTDDYDKEDEMFYNTGNYFRTREEAEDMAEKIRRLINGV